MGKHKGKILAALGMLVIGAAILAMRWQVSEAQTNTGPKPFKLDDISSAMSSNPGSNYTVNASGAWQNDNYGISIWTGNFPTPYTECAHLGMPATLSTTIDSTQVGLYEKRNVCSGNIAIGAADKVGEQIITITGTSNGKTVTLPVNVPAVTGTSLGNWRFYVDDTGATYYCRSDHSYTGAYPNDCDLTVEQALVPAHLARAGAPAVCGNNICQTGETYNTCTSDCPSPVYTFSWQLVTAATPPSIEAKAGSKALSKFKLINTGDTEANYTVDCSLTAIPAAAANLQKEYKLYTPTETSLGSANPSVTLAPGTSKEIGLSVDVSTATAGTIQVSCLAHRVGGTDDKVATDTITVIAPVVTTSSCTGINLSTDKTSYLKSETEYVNYTYSCAAPSPTATISYIAVQVVKPDGTATTYNTGTNISVAQKMGFSTSNLDVGSYLLRTCLNSTCSAGSTNSVSFTITASGTSTPTPTPSACENNAKCPKGSWCSSGSMCHYPDSQITCVPWPVATTGTAAAAPMMNPSCPSGTSPCSPDDTNCVAPGQPPVPYSSSGMSKWCAQSQQYYSTDGKYMKCVKWGDPEPDGYSTCRPDDANCIPSGKYGPSSGWCSMGMQCHQKATDNDPKNDKYCTPMNYSSTDPSAVSCPDGYSYCSLTDTYCKEKNDSWTDSNSGYWCSNSQKCTLGSGGGTCVGWNELCPAGTKYCSTTDTYCIEPGEYKTLSSASGSGVYMSYWCGGGGGMIFYSATKAYCEPKKAGFGMAMMWNAADIKAVLTKLGTGWGLCSPGNTNCIEPGKTGPSSGWCAWMPPNSSYTPSTGLNSTRTCPALDSSTTPPPIEPVLPPTPEICLQVLTKALNSSTGECKVFPNSCLPVGWVRNTDCKPGGIVPPEQLPLPTEPRECGPNEMPGMGNNYCKMPMHRWNIEEKRFEKCDSNNPPPYINVKDNPTAKFTNCESFNYEIEREWRTERFLAHDPRVDGEWYMPPWDATSKSVQYDPRTDSFGECKTDKDKWATGPAGPAGPARVVPEYTAPCTPVPEIDRGWMLKKFRAEYRMYKLWQGQNQPLLPGEPVYIEPLMPEFPIPPVPVIPLAQCRGHLSEIRNGIVGDKQFWKDIRRQVGQVPRKFPDLTTINQLLGDAQTLIAKNEQLVKAGKCKPEILASINENNDRLHNDIFPELSSYMSDIQDFVQYQQCRKDITGQLERLHGLLKNGLNDEEKEVVDALISHLEATLKDFEGNVGDLDLNFQCEDSRREVEEQMAPLLRRNDKDLNRIIEDVVTDKLEPVFTRLSQQLEDRGKKLDELLVQVAQLHKAVEEVSKSATQISERIATSYTALSRVEDKFAEQRALMQAAKDRLIAKLEQATLLMQERRCVSTPDRELLIQEFGTVAAVNWFGERADAIEKRLNLLIGSCQAKDLAPADVVAFRRNIVGASADNLRASYQAGFTPFPDVPTHEWFYGGMLTAARNGYMTQGRPGEHVLKQDALLMVMRAAGKTDAELMGDCVLPAGFYINDVSPYAKCAVVRALEKGLSLRGDMRLPVSRADVALWISQLIPGLKDGGRYTLKNYTDLAELSADQLDGVRIVVANGVMVGQVSADRAIFQPYDPLTRAALAVVLEKILAVTHVSTTAELPR